MSLKIQIISIVFNFFYGIFYTLLVLRFKRYLMLQSKYAKIICNFIFMCFSVFCYYFILVNINYGVLNFYYLLFLFSGALVGYQIYSILCKV